MEEKLKGIHQIQAPLHPHHLFWLDDMKRNNHPHTHQPSLPSLSKYIGKGLNSGRDLLSRRTEILTWGMSFYNFHLCGGKWGKLSPNIFTLPKVRACRQTFLTLQFCMSQKTLPSFFPLSLDSSSSSSSLLILYLRADNFSVEHVMLLLDPPQDEPSDEII